MRKIIHWVHTSIDGHIAGPNGEFDWPEMGPELSAYSFGLQDRADTFLYGRKVWEIMSSYWPHAETMSDDEHDLKFAPIWREAPKVVVSRTITEAGWGTRVIGGRDLAEEITALRREPGGDLLLTGGAGLAASLTALGLIDEYHVAVHPVVLGGGPSAFPEGTQRFGLTLVEAQTCDGRVVVSRFTKSCGDGRLPPPG